MTRLALLAWLGIAAIAAGCEYIGGYRDITPEGSAAPSTVCSEIAASGVETATSLEDPESFDAFALRLCRVALCCESKSGKTARRLERYCHPALHSALREIVLAEPRAQIEQCFALLKEDCPAYVDLLRNNCDFLWESLTERQSCDALASRGTSCNGHGDCALDDRCLLTHPDGSEKICRPALELQDRCERRDPSACKATLWCDWVSSDLNVAEGAGECRNFADAGGACDWPSVEAGGRDSCAGLLVCTPSGNETATCEQGAGPGQPCKTGRPCRPGLRCSVESRTCVELHGPGERCETWEQCPDMGMTFSAPDVLDPFGPRVPIFECIGGTCQPLPSEDERCEERTECLQGDCIGGVCTLLEAGAPCTRNLAAGVGQQCRGYCDKDRCVPKKDGNAPCRADYECSTEAGSRCVLEPDGEFRCGSCASLR